MGRTTAHSPSSLFELSDNFGEITKFQVVRQLGDKDPKRIFPTLIKKVTEKDKKHLTSSLADSDSNAYGMLGFPEMRWGLRKSLADNAASAGPYR